jgi:hypothetical protein
MKKREEKDMKKKILIVSIITAFLMFSMPFVSSLQTQLASTESHNKLLQENQPDDELDVKYLSEDITTILSANLHWFDCLALFVIREITWWRYSDSPPGSEEAEFWHNLHNNLSDLYQENCGGSTSVKVNIYGDTPLGRITVIAQSDKCKCIPKRPTQQSLTTWR